MEEPKRRLTPQEARILRTHCGVFSRMGGALLAQMGGMLAVQTLAFAAAALLAPGLAGQPVFLWTISLVSAYGVGFPLFCLVIRTLPAAPAPERRTPLAPVRLFQVYLISMAALYLSNYATLALIGLIGLVRGAPVTNPVESLGDYPMVLNLLLGCVVAPLAEEAAFRGLLLRRLCPYGEKFAMFASALCFGLFHGNLNQMFYAFALGLIFAYVVLRTGCLWQAMLLHALVNLAGIELPALADWPGRWSGYLLGGLVLLFLFGGVGCMIALAREVWFQKDGYPMPERQKWRLFFENPGIICFCLLAAGVAASYLLL